MKQHLLDSILYTSVFQNVSVIGDALSSVLLTTKHVTSSYIIPPDSLDQSHDSLKFNVQVYSSHTVVWFNTYRDRDITTL